MPPSHFISLQEFLPAMFFKIFFQKSDPKLLLNHFPLALSPFPYVFYKRPRSFT